MSSSKGSRTVLIFLVLIIVILVCGVAISLFLLQKETQSRMAVESSLEVSKERNARVEAALKESEKQVEVLKGKNKDADEKINNLMEELDLEAALRDEIKAENKKLKELIEAEGKSKVEMRQKLTAELDAVKAKLTALVATSADNAQEAAALRKTANELQKKNAELEAKLKDVEEMAGARPRSEILPVPGQPGDEKVDLDRIVISPGAAKEGRVLNVDSETEFLIFDLGSKNGIKQNDVMSIYRGKTFLGDVKVSRVQDDMAAADFIPPFSSRKVRKNDQVVPKR
ncbi:MAG: hypothetical protein HQL20_04475 [Candidatus Omnitrophica bacterium]|nr:hypothetical protein [Candidatus Omnitrophota bacterium]